MRAAGGVVSRSVADAVEVLLVHRPRYDDWTLPKGKADGDEPDEECALREVTEETGYRCEILWELAGAAYRDSKDRPKRVRYFAMRPLGGEFTPTHEIDQIRWLPPRAAEETVSYSRDAVVIGSFGYDGRERLLLVRHGSAGKRKRWTGDDRLRPLDRRGRTQAGRLVETLAGHALTRILSSPFTRCVETLAPLADARGLPVEEREELAEGAGLEPFLRLAGELRAAALCVHGDLVEALLGEALPKGSTTLLEPGSLDPIATLPPPA